MVEKLDVIPIPDPDPAEEAAIQRILAGLDREWSPEEESAYNAEMNAAAAGEIEQARLGGQSMATKTSEEIGLRVMIQQLERMAEQRGGNVARDLVNLAVEVQRQATFRAFELEGSDSSRLVRALKDTVAEQ